MPLSLIEAKQLLQKQLSNGDVQKGILYNGLYVFRVFNPVDPVEGESDPFFSVDPNTGKLAEFSILTDANIVDFTNAFTASN